MLSVLVAAAIALLITLFGTPLFVRYLRRRSYGQFIREDGPTSHFTKRGTPTMGGVIIIFAAIAGYLTGNLVVGRAPHVTGWLLIYLLAGMGLIGFLDDFTKVRKERSLGLTPMAKIIGQGIVGVSLNSCIKTPFDFLAFIFYTE